MATNIEQWKKEAEQYCIRTADIENIAQSIYYANWKELPNLRFPPCWENVSDEVRDFVMNQAVRATLAVECNVAVTPEVLEEIAV